MRPDETEVEVIKSPMHGGSIMLVPDYLGKKHPVIDAKTGKVSVFDTDLEVCQNDYPSVTQRRARAILRCRMWRIFGVKPEDVRSEKSTFSNFKSASDSTFDAKKLAQMLFEFRFRR